VFLISPAGTIAADESNDEGKFQAFFRTELSAQSLTFPLPLPAISRNIQASEGPQIPVSWIAISKRLA
jgi:hypothetical protein